MFVDYIFLRLFGVPLVEHISMLLCWPHPSALVAYNGGTNVGHGPVTTLFLSLILFLSCHDSFLGPDFVSSANDTM